VYWKSGLTVVGLKDQTPTSECQGNVNGNFITVALEDFVKQ
jgi:hypothetical protein